MADSQSNALAQAREALRAFPPALLQEFETANDKLAEMLSSAEQESWAQDGVSIARHSLRSWEAAGDYFRASPAMLDQLTYPRFRDWIGTGNELLEASPALAGAYYRSSPSALEYLSVTQAKDWGEQGRSLYKGTWKSGSLAAQYFEVSPSVLPQLPLSQTRLLVDVIDALASHSYELASACLTMSPNVLEQLDRPDRAPFLEFGSVVANTAWVDARVYFERGPTLVRQVHPQQRARYLALASRVALNVGRLGHPYFMEAAQALAEVDRDSHRELLELAEGIVPQSGIAAMEFIKASPNVLRRLRPEDLPRWQEKGREILESSVDGGEAFFRLESSKGEDIIESLSSRVELERVSELIRMYAKALTGTDVSIQSAENLAEKGVGWVDGQSPTTEGTSIYLPPMVEKYASKEDNFAVYKVFATHQAARLEFGSFGFEFDRPGGIFGAKQREGGQSVVPRPQTDGETSGPITDMERFFDLFEDRLLAHDLFTIIEDTRIDNTVKREYAGIRKSFSRLQDEAMERRRPVEEMPARQAMVENLLRASLDARSQIKWPGQLSSLMEEPLRVLERLRDGEATVEDSAEATLMLYDWLSRVPNVKLESPDWEDLDLPPTEMDGEEEGDLMPGASGGEGEESSMPNMPGSEEPYESPDPVDFRGDFKPELVQLLMKLKSQDGTGDQPPVPLTKEQLQELLEKNVEISINEMTDGDLSESSGMFLDNLMKEVEQAQQAAQNAQKQNGEDPGGEEDDTPLEEEPESFYYDEWDFRANDYKPRWCRVQEQRIESGSTEFYDKILHENSALVRETRKQFELLKPETFRKIKRLPDGEDFDLDAVIEWYVERIAGAVSEQKLFYRRNKVERDVAVAFLLDMSASTDEEIQKTQHRAGDDDQFDDDPRKYLSWWAQRRAQEAKNPGKRIIDLEKEAVVLLIEALETIGDTYGVYGFSGYGRDNVEFYVIKDTDEPFDDKIKKRVDKIAPVRSTRMGPAIRHTVAKLKETGAKIKILVLISDGRPQDHGYGRDRTEKEYAIHDTKMALTEARREGMTPFALTVDRAGHDYLQQMCTDMGYEVVSDIESLPRRLPTLYRSLTQ
jgi:nitric oxide reductase NorD protein